MSRGPWKPKPAQEVQRLIDALEARDYRVTSVEIADGIVRVSVRDRDATTQDQYEPVP
jgi:hypothetical protein